MIKKEISNKNDLTNLLEIENILKYPVPLIEKSVFLSEDEVDFKYGIIVEENAITGLKLTLDEKLTSIPDAIWKLNNLQLLKIQGSISSLPKKIGNLTKLTYLDLENNNLTSLPSTFGNLKNLNILYLDGNKLINLSDSIGLLRKLQVLRISNNLLSSLPDSLSKLNYLMELDLSYNQLTNLPKTLENLTSLKYLYLQYNKLSNLPKNIGNLTNLLELDLRYNDIMTPPDSIKLLRKCRILTFETEIIDFINSYFGLKIELVMNLDKENHCYRESDGKIRELKISNASLNFIPDSLIINYLLYQNG
jgi:Leucine-rich repeat (LRR) protein